MLKIVSKNIEKEEEENKILLKKNIILLHKAN